MKLKELKPANTIAEMSTILGFGKNRTKAFLDKCSIPMTLIGGSYYVWLSDLEANPKLYQSLIAKINLSQFEPLGPESYDLSEET